MACHVGFSRSVLALAMLSFAATGSTPAAGQTPAVLGEATRAYEDLDFARARGLLAGFIEEPGRSTASDLARAHLLLGVIEYTEGYAEAARSRFASALQLDPGIRPDPASISPKILEYFDTLVATPGARTADADIRYVTLVDDRPGAALRSMVLPGWGQLHKGERTKGIVLVSAWAATAGATVIANAARSNARERYIDEVDPNLVSQRYDEFNRRHKARNALALSAAGVWLVAYVEALATPGRATMRPVHLMVAPAFEGGALDGATIGARIRIGR